MTKEEDIIKARKVIEEVNQEKIEDNNGELLKRAADRAVKTAMIGALDAFEKVFGYLWGYGKKSQLSGEQKEFYEMWQSVRCKILDKGHYQIGLLKELIDAYNCRERRYKMTFKCDNKGVGRQEGDTNADWGDKNA